MKLPTQIAGTLALPLALAVAASTQAATIVDTAQHRLNIGGFVTAQTQWISDTNRPANADDTLDNSFNLGTSRFNVAYTNKEHGTTFFYEQGLGAGNTSLRHAYLATSDGIVAGWTLSFFGNAVGGGDTLDNGGLTTYSARQDRNALLGKRFSLGDGLTLGVALEQVAGGTWGDVDTPRDTAAPDITVNFTGKFGAATVFAAAQQFNYGDGAGTNTDPWTEDDSTTRFTFGLNLPVGDIGLRAAATVVTDLYTAFSVAGQFKVSDAVRTNLILEQYLDEGDNADFTSVWVNAFYKATNGVEWGGEVQFVSGDAATPGAGQQKLADGDFAVRVQAKYAF